MSFNSITLVGTLANDPIVKDTTNSKLCTFQLVVERPIRDREGKKLSDLFMIICWGKIAENVGKYMRKGRMLSLHGSIYKKTYTDKNGNMNSVWEVTANQVQFLPQRLNQSNQSNQEKK